MGGDSKDGEGLSEVDAGDGLFSLPGRSKPKGHLAPLAEPIG